MKIEQKSELWAVTKLLTLYQKMLLYRVWSKAFDTRGSVSFLNSVEPAGSGRTYNHVACDG